MQTSLKPANPNYEYRDDILVCVWTKALEAQHVRYAVLASKTTTSKNNNLDTDLKTDDGDEEIPSSKLTSIPSLFEETIQQKPAGLVLAKDGTPYRSPTGSTVSLCQAVDPHPQATAVPGQSLQIALAQCHAWQWHTTQLHVKTTPLTTHRLLFPYHAGTNH